MNSNLRRYGTEAPIPLLSPDVPWTRRQVEELRAFSRKALENRLLDAVALAEYGLGVGERLSEVAWESGRRVLPVLRRRELWEWTALWGGISLWLLY